MRIVAFALLLVMAASSAARANVRLARIFGSHMVLQQGRPLPFWGNANSGETVSVELLDKKAEGKAGPDGHWRVDLPAIEAVGSAASSFSVTIQGENKIVLDDVVLGEVWVASGQSNMEFVLKNANDGEAEVRAAGHPELRLFHVDHGREVDLSGRDLKGEWRPCTPESAGNFSAVGYFFAREVAEKTGKPVGVIDTSWGGTRVEAWTRFDAFRKNPRHQKLIGPYMKPAAEIEKAIADYKVALEQWEQANKTGDPAFTPDFSTRPKQPPGARDQSAPGALWQSMVAPMVPLAIRGAIWYQGEANATRGQQYRELFPLMIRDWRQQWGQGDFPFLFVQLTAFHLAFPGPGHKSEVEWPELREAQFLTLRALPETGMAVTIDVGDRDNIHPKNKQDVGKRLAQWALAKVYKQDVEASGPLYKTFRKEKGAIRVTFDYARGLRCADGKRLVGFEIAGADRLFMHADARVDGDSVVVSAAVLKNPVAVRYAWSDDPIGNLRNEAGLPAAPFRTDSWPGLSDGKEW